MWLIICFENKRYLHMPYLECDTQIWLVCKDSQSFPSSEEVDIKHSGYSKETTGVVESLPEAENNWDNNGDSWEWLLGMI